MVHLPAVLACIAAVAARKESWKFENLVTFGDSYTDENRLGSLFENGGEWPPPGTVLGPSNTTASGGKIWSRFVAEETDANLFNYAVAGASCSLDIISRPFDALGRPFPGILDDEIPGFEADLETEPYSSIDSANTLFSVWIGTNDLGAGAFLTDSQAPGKIITDFTDCVWETFDRIYATGGRRFVLLNQAPLEIAPMYDAETGIDSSFWPDHTTYNMTEQEFKIRQYTTNVNTMFEYGIPFQLLVEKRWPGAEVALFNVHDLILDMHDDPEQYLEAPADVEGVFKRCDPENPDECEESENPRDSFLWFDELHVSERVNELFAKEFLEVVQGKSKYGRTFESRCS